MKVNDFFNDKKISMRDKILLFLKIASVANVRQLRILLGTKSIQINKILSYWQTQKKIKGYRTNRSFKGYMLTKLGSNFLESKYPDIAYAVSTEKQIQHKLSVVDHLIFALDVNLDVEWIDEKLSIYKKNNAIMMRNDARMVIGNRTYWIEQDMGTQTSPVLKKKFKNISEVIEEMQKEISVKEGVRKLPLDALIVSTNLEYLEPKEILPICGKQVEKEGFFDNPANEVYISKYEISDEKDLDNFLKALSPNNRIRKISDKRKELIENAIMNDKKNLQSLYHKMLYQDLKIYVAANYELPMLYKNIKNSMGLVLSLFDKKDTFVSGFPNLEKIHLNFLTTGFLDIESFCISGYNVILIDYDYCLSDRIKLSMLLENVHKELNCIVIVISSNYKDLKLNLPIWHNSFAKLRKNAFYCFYSYDFELYSIQGSKIELLER